MSRILLCASASVAVYKACDVASKLYQAGHELTTVLTPRAAELVSPQLFEAVSGGPALSTEFGEGRRGAMDHIDLARFAELVVVAPCSADLVGRLANGLSGDLLSTALLAVDSTVPRLLCPAMNPTMLGHPAVQRNLGQLREDGWEVMEPASGHMACGEAGAGRLVEPSEIVARVEELLT
jgi:phosphopantothenoylcysteine decarboxylase/phosphopantothenate--cysteine ligase